MEKFLHNVSYAIAKKLFISSNTEVDQAKIVYGVETIVLMVSEASMIFLLALILNTFRMTIILTLFFGWFRIVSGGFHCKTFFGCFLMSSLILVGLPTMSNFISINRLILILMFLIIIILTSIYAPAGSAEHPVLEAELGKRKRKSVITVCIYACIAFILLNPYREGILLVTMAQTITLFPRKTRKDN